MKIEHSVWSEPNGWESDKPFASLGESAGLVLAFCGAGPEAAKKCLSAVRAAYPNAVVFGCSSGGEIQNTQVFDETFAATAIAFEHTTIKAARAPITRIEDSFQAGADVVGALARPGLRHVFLVSEGLKVNGSEVIRGVNSALPDGVSLSGGFASDDQRLQNTYIWCEGDPEQSALAAIGFYGDRLRVGVAVSAGWEPFGPERLVTRSKNNVLYEFDGTSALAVYKRYLGEHAAGLPITGVLYPIQVRDGDCDERLLRTLLAVDEEEQSMTFAGEIPEGSVARLMFGNVDRVIEGVKNGKQVWFNDLQAGETQFGIVVSCSARRPVLKQRIEEEVEAVIEIIGCSAPLAGFYSYGEIAPTKAGGKAELHNQTMTITCFAED